MDISDGELIEEIYQKLLQKYHVHDYKIFEIDVSSFIFDYILEKISYEFFLKILFNKIVTICDNNYRYYYISCKTTYTLESNTLRLKIMHSYRCDDYDFIGYIILDINKLPMMKSANK